MQLRIHVHFSLEVSFLAVYTVKRVKFWGGNWVNFGVKSDEGKVGLEWDRLDIKQGLNLFKDSTPIKKIFEFKKNRGKITLFWGWKRGYKTCSNCNKRMNQWKSSLADAERLLAQHESLQEEVAHALPRYQNLKQQGQDQVSLPLKIFFNWQGILDSLYGVEIRELTARQKWVGETDA